MKRLEIFPLDSCERGEDGKGEKGGGGLERKFFSHGRETSKTIVARTSTFHVRVGGVQVSEIRTEG